MVTEEAILMKVLHAAHILQIFSKVEVTPLEKLHSVSWVCIARLNNNNTTNGSAFLEQL